MKRSKKSNYLDSHGEEALKKPAGLWRMGSLKLCSDICRGHYLFREGNSFSRAYLKENCDIAKFAKLFRRTVLRTAN